jgi:hypothetical protein
VNLGQRARSDRHGALGGRRHSGEHRAEASGEAPLVGRHASDLLHGVGSPKRGEVTDFGRRKRFGIARAAKLDGRARRIERFAPDRAPQPGDALGLRATDGHDGVPLRRSRGLEVLGASNTHPRGIAWASIRHWLRSRLKNDRYRCSARRNRSVDVWSP